MRAINFLLSILMSLAVAALVLEGGLRILGMGPTPSIQRFDPELGWSKTPGAEGRRKTNEFDVTYEINALGLRDDPMTSPAKPAGTFRVLMLGDSFVLGYTVDRAHLFVDQLERWWKAEGRNVDVINAGTEGYSTDQEALWFSSHGAAFAPDLVVLFPYENDLYWNSQTSYLHFPKPRINPDGQKELRALADPGKKSKLESTALGAWIAKLTSGTKPPMWSFSDPQGETRQIPTEWASYFADENAQAFMKDAYTRTRGALIHLQTSCEKVGSKLVVVPIPGKACVHGQALTAFESLIGSSASPGAATGTSGWSPDRPVETVLGMCRDLAIPALDARPKLRAAAQDEGDLYFASDWHFNAAGNTAFAEFVHDALDAIQAFPSSVAATRTVSLPHEPKASGVPTFVFVYLALWAVISTLYALTYRDEPLWRAPLQVGVMLALVFTIFLGVRALVGRLPPQLATPVMVLVVGGILTFVLIKLGRRVGTITELFFAFARRGHWYLMPLVVVLLTVGSLLVVAASSPLVAPFIYTLF